jgi:hypothetical protein
MSDDDEKLAERIARERWNAVLVADGQRMTGICKALRESCPELEMDGTCPHLSAQESLEGKL